MSGIYHGVIVTAWANWVRWSVALLLIVAAILKFYGLMTDPLASHSLLGSSRWELALIQVEWLLGLWLLSGIWSRACWAVAMVFFSGALVVTVYQGWTGQVSCGCLGRVQAHPWAMALLDALVLSALTLSARAWWPDRADAGTKPIFRRWLFALAILLALVLAVITLSPNPARTLAHIRGQPLAMRPFVSELGEATASEWRTFQVEIVNFSNRSYSVVGGTTHCACRTTQNLPSQCRLRVACKSLLPAALQANTDDLCNNFSYIPIVLSNRYSLADSLVVCWPLETLPGWQTTSSLATLVLTGQLRHDNHLMTATHHRTSSQ